MPLAGREVVQVKIGPTLRGAHGQFFANPMEETAHALKTSEVTGGHGEAHTEVQREALTILTRQHFVNRAIYDARLVIYNIADAGRQPARNLSS